MSDKVVKKYFENMPYGSDSKAIEIHGKRNKIIASKYIASLVRNYDQAMAEEDKEKAGMFYDAVTKLNTQFENLKQLKEEFAMNYGGGVGGKNQYSNYTDLSWDRKFWTEQGDIAFDANMELVCTAYMDDGSVVDKKVEDISENWTLKGTAEADFMRMQQDAVKQSNTVNKPLDFDIDFAVNNMLVDQDNWKPFVSDKIGGRYFLQDYLLENQEAFQAGQIPDEMLGPDSFNPEFDNRLHAYYADRLRKSFDPNFKTSKEKQQEKINEPEQNQKTFKASKLNVEPTNNK